MVAIIALKYKYVQPFKKGGIKFKKLKKKKGVYQEWSGCLNSRNFFYKGIIPCLFNNRTGD